MKIDSNTIMRSHVVHVSVYEINHIYWTRKERGNYRERERKRAVVRAWERARRKERERERGRENVKHPATGADATNIPARRLQRLLAEYVTHGAAGRGAAEMLRHTASVLLLVECVCVVWVACSNNKNNNKDKK